MVFGMLMVLRVLQKRTKSVPQVQRIKKLLEKLLRNLYKMNGYPKILRKRRLQKPRKESKGRGNVFYGSNNNIIINGCFLYRFFFAVYRAESSVTKGYLLILLMYFVSYFFAKNGSRFSKFDQGFSIPFVYI